MVYRRGLGQGKGKGYHNMISKDPRVHSLSAKGIKQPQEPKVMHTATGSKYTAQEIIKKAFGDSKNILTPNIESYGKISPNIAYEISYGDGLYNDTIYGVTLVKINNDGSVEKMPQHSHAFPDRREAGDYVFDLKKSKDSDKDGIPDKFDCDPDDPDEQDIKAGLEKTLGKAKELTEKGVKKAGEFTKKEAMQVGEMLREGGSKGVQIAEKQAPKLKEFLKKEGKKAVEATKEGGKKLAEVAGEEAKKAGEFAKEEAKEGLEQAKESIEESRQESKIEEVRDKAEQLKDIGYPAGVNFMQQKNYVDSLKKQVANATGQQQEKLRKTLYKQQKKLNEMRENIVNIKLEDLTDEQLKQLAVRNKPDPYAIFPQDNMFEEELIRRIRYRKKLNNRIENAKEAPLSE